MNNVALTESWAALSAESDKNNFLHQMLVVALQFKSSNRRVGQITFDIPLNVTIWTRKLGGVQIND